MVLEDVQGPQPCLGGVLDSLPPQGAGPEIVGWNWGEVSGFESAGGVRWGTAS